MKNEEWADLSHNPMNKNLILGTGHWGTGEMGRWGKEEEVSGNDSTARNERKIFDQRNSKTIAPMLQRPIAPSSSIIADNNSFFGSQIMRKLRMG